MSMGYTLHPAFFGGGGHRGLLPWSCIETASALESWIGSMRTAEHSHGKLKVSFLCGRGWMGRKMEENKLENRQEKPCRRAEAGYKEITGLLELPTAYSILKGRGGWLHSTMRLNTLSSPII